MGYEIDFIAVGNSAKSGDAIAMRFGNLIGRRDEQTVIVIDGGFQDSGQAMVEHIKTHYGTDRIDLMILTHPDADHANGLLEVMDNMTVDVLAMHIPWHQEHTDGISEWFHDGRVTDNSVREQIKEALESAWNLHQKAKAKGVTIREPFAGSQLDLPNGKLTVLGPSKGYYQGLIPYFRSTPEPAKEVKASFFSTAGQFLIESVRKIREDWNFETLTDDKGGDDTSAENQSSVILHIEHDGHELLFTGDAGIEALTQAADYKGLPLTGAKPFRFIQVPHHGSARNVGPTILNRLIGPKADSHSQTVTAFVSVAKDGAPKHPSKQTLNAFHRRGAPVYQTAGISIRHQHDAPNRSGWSNISPHNLYPEFDA